MFKVNVASSRQSKAMNKTPKDDESTTARTSFIKQDGKRNPVICTQDGSSQSSLTNSATTTEDSYHLQSTSSSDYSPAHVGPGTSPSSPSLRSRLRAGTSRNFLDDNARSSNASRFTGPPPSPPNGATLHQGSPSGSTTPDGQAINYQVLLNETAAGLATLEITVNGELRPHINVVDSRISRLDGADSEIVERLDIMERYVKVMVGCLVIFFALLLFALFK